jgi:hypothetical protein
MPSFPSSQEPIIVESVENKLKHHFAQQNRLPFYEHMSVQDIMHELMSLQGFMVHGSAREYCEKVIATYLKDNLEDILQADE